MILALAIITAGLTVAPETAKSSGDRIELAPADGRKGYPASARAEGYTYIAWADAGRGIALRRIDDDGNVTQPSGIETTGIYYQPQISASGSHVYVTWSQNFTLNNNQPFETMLAWSADYGQSFQTLRLTTSPTFAGQVDVLSPTIASSGDLVAIAWRQGGSGQLWIAEYGQEAFAQNVALAGLEPSDVAIAGGKVHAISIESTSRARKLTSVTIVGGAVTTTTVTATPAGSPAKLAAHGPNVYAAWVDATPVEATEWDDLLVLSVSSDSGATFTGAIVSTNRCRNVNLCVAFDLEVWNGLPFLGWEHSGRVLESHGFVPGLGGLTAPVLVSEQDPFAGGSIDLVVSGEGVFVTYLTTIPDAADPTIRNWEVMVAARRHGSAGYGDVRNLSRTDGGSFLPALSARGRGTAVAWTEWLGSAFSGPCCSVLYEPSIIATDDLELTSAEAVQASYGAERLAAGKPTVVRVQFRNGFTTEKTVRISMILENAGNSIVETEEVPLKPDGTQIFLRADNPFRPEPGDLSVKVTLDATDAIPETDEANNTAEAAYKVKDTRGLRVLFVPIDTPGDSILTPKCSQMESFALTNGAYLDATFPVDPDETHYKGSCTPLEVPVVQKLTTEQLDDLTFNKLDAMNTGNKWDAVVGVYRKRWLDDHTVDFSIPLPSGGYAGLAGFASPQKSVLASIEGSGGWEVAHEISHLLGWVESGHALEDPTTQSGHLVFQASPGYWVEHMTRIHDKADLMFNSTQGASLADPLGRWLSPATYDFLLGKFAYDPVDPPLISLRARINGDDTVETPAWYEDDGFLDVELGAAGDYDVRYLDGAGNLVGETALDGSDSFSGGTEEGHAVTPSGFVDLAAKIPDVDGAATIQLWRGATLLYERVRTDNAPTVSVTSPASGDVIRTGSDMAVEWDASDPDGDTLSHIVSISTDGGASWLPLASDLTGTSVSLPVRRDLIGTGALIKVLTSDGWRTTEAVSDPFDIVLGTALEEKIVFHACCVTDTGQDVHIISPDGTGLHPLPLVGTQMWPEISPDGTLILFVDYESRSLKTMAPDGSDVRLVLAGTGFWDFMEMPRWSPDGSKILFTRYDGSSYHPWIVDADGTDARKVLDIPAMGGMGVAGLDWHPSGTKFIFSTYKRPPFSDTCCYHLYESDLEGNVTQLTTTNVNHQYPDYSSDGTKIAFSNGTSGNTKHIWVMDADGTDRRNLTAAFSCNSIPCTDQLPSWSPPGTHLVYQGGQPGTSISIIDEGGTTRTSLVSSISGQAPRWGEILIEGAEPEEPAVAPVVADSGGPYTATEGTPIRLDASASSGVGDLTYEWDLDSDGDFSDASGVDPLVPVEDDGDRRVAVRVTDETSRFESDEATIAVSNTAPALTDVSATMVPGAPAGLHARVSDAGAADVLTANIDWGDGTVAEATLAREGDGFAVYGSHDYASAGNFDVAVTATDDDGDSDTEVVVLDVAPANLVPTAAGISTSTAQDTAVEVVLDGNDPDGAPGTLAFEIVGLPANGTLGGLPFLGAPGEPVRVTYFPGAGFSGSDSFTYRVYDGMELSTVATVSVTVVASGGSDPGSGGDPGSTPDPTPTVTPSVPVPTPTTEPTPEPEPERCTITGTADDDRLQGTTGDDVICAGAGDDVVFGRGGDDVVLAGRGRDRVRAGEGSDEVFGRRGADVLRGGSGLDVLFGGSARDALFGGAGRDRLEGGPHRDALDGGAGSDVCTPEPAATLVHCESTTSEEREPSSHEQRRSRPARWGSRT